MAKKATQIADSMTACPRCLSTKYVGRTKDDRVKWVRHRRGDFKPPTLENDPIHIQYIFATIARYIKPPLRSLTIVSAITILWYNCLSSG